MSSFPFSLIKINSMMHSSRVLLILSLFGFLFVSGCEKDNNVVINEPPKETKKDSIDSKNDEQQLLSKAKKYYLKTCFSYYYWHDEMDSTVKALNQSSFDNIYDFFEATLYPRDRWSWMADGSYYAQSETGEYSGTYGASLMQQIEYYNDYDIRVAYVYPGSSFERNGVKRGWILTKIADRPVMETVKDGSFYSEYSKSPQTFTFADNDGATHTFTAQSTSLETKSALLSTVFMPSDFPGLNEPVGYFHYLAFKADFLNDIHEAISKFKQADVHKLILDLRYNGGGDSRASQLLVNYLAPKSADHKPYVHRSHNKAHQDEDIVDSISRIPGALDLDALYCIVSSGTASASEMIMNGLRPYLDVTMVGDTTYGKPNGMYVFLYPDNPRSLNKYNNGDYSDLKYVFLPISFFNKNGVGDIIPEEGFIPDNYRPDDLKHEFGVEEDNIKACLTKIVTGSFPELPPVKQNISTRAGAAGQYRLPDNRSPFYGLTIEPFPGQLE